MKRLISVIVATLILIMSSPISQIFAVTQPTVTESCVFDVGSWQYQKSHVETFIQDNVTKNRLKGLVPAVTGIGHTNDYSWVQWSNLTDGAFTTSIQTEPFEIGNIFTYTYTLDSITKISDVILMCEKNNFESFGVEYEIYVSNEDDNLFNIENQVYDYNFSTSSGGAQKISFPEGDRPTGQYVGFRFTGQRCMDARYYAYRLSELGVYGEAEIPKPKLLQSSAYEITHPNYQSSKVEDFIVTNKGNNALAGIIPTVSGVGHSNDFSWVEWSNLTDGDFATTTQTEPKNIGNVFTYTYKIPFRISISDFVVMCEKNKVDDFGIEYEIYVADSESELFGINNLVYKYNLDANSGGAQLISFPKAIRPTGAYIGFRFLGQKNTNANYYAYRLSEIGVWGIKELSLPEVKESCEYEIGSSKYEITDVENYIKNNNNSNLLKGLSPAVNGLGWTNDYTNVSWNNLTDGDFMTSTQTEPRNVGNVFEYTYTLKQKTKISQIAIMCEKNKTDFFGLEYEIYVSETNEDLFDGKNLIFVKNLESFKGGAQLLTFKEDDMPIGTYVGFKFVGQQNKDAGYFAYRLSEIGVWGTEIIDRRPYIVYHTQDNLTEIKNQLKQPNLLYGKEPDLYDITLPNKKWSKEKDASTATNWITLYSGNFDKFHDSKIYENYGQNEASHSDIYPGKNKGNTVLTYKLDSVTKIENILMVGAWIGFGKYCTQEYEIYVSDIESNLYDNSNLIIKYNNGDRYNPNIPNSGGGQMFVFREKPIGKYIGIRFTDENPTDELIRIEEIGVYGEKLDDSETNLLGDKSGKYYLTDGADTKIITDEFSVDDIHSLVDGNINDDILVKSNGKNIEIIYDLCKETPIEKFLVATFDTDRVLQYSVYAASKEDALNLSSSKLGTYVGSVSEGNEAIFRPENNITARFVKIVIEEYNATNLRLAEVAAIGSIVFDLQLKNVINNTPDADITAYINRKNERDIAKVTNDTAKINLTDMSTDTSLNFNTISRFYGAKNGESFDIVFKLPNSKLISEFEFYGVEGSLPKKITYYIGDSEEAILSANANPVAVYDFGLQNQVNHKIKCKPTAGLFVRMNVIPNGEGASDDTNAVSIADFKANGIYIEGFMDDCGDLDVLKSFRFNDVGLFIKIYKLYSNDIWNKIAKAEIKKRPPNDVEIKTLEELDLSVYNSIVSIRFYDVEGNLITNLDGRDMLVEFKIPKGEAVYLGQTDGNFPWIIDASYSDDSLYYYMDSKNISFDFLMAIDNIKSFDYLPEKEEAPLKEDNSEIFKEEIKIENQDEYISKIGTGKHTVPTESKDILKENPVIFYILIGILCLEFLIMASVIIIKLIKKRRRF